MKITNEIKKFNIDVVKAINFMLANDSPLSLLINMASTPSIGVKSKDDNNMYKKKKKISTSISYGMVIVPNLLTLHHIDNKVINSW
jgi:hypothetical protein